MKNGSQLQLESGSQTRLTRGLLGKSKAELVGIILRLEARLHRYEPAVAQDKTRVLQTSEAYAPNLATLSFRTRIGAVDYRRLPHAPARTLNGREDTAWKVILISADPTHKALALEVYDDVVVGRRVEGTELDLDLAAYNAGSLGVSRRHALLRPSRLSLFLIDLGSSNGTYCNGVRMSVGQAQRLREREIISFGKLHFMLHRVIHPANT